MLLVIVCVKIAQFRSPKFKPVFGNSRELTNKRLLGISFLTSNFWVILKVNCSIEIKYAFQQLGPSG